MHVSRSIRTEDNFIVLYRVREICREFILGQLSQREFFDSNVYFYFLLDSRGQLFEHHLQTAKENIRFAFKLQFQLQWIRKIFIDTPTMKYLRTCSIFTINRSSFLDVFSFNRKTFIWNKLNIKIDFENLWSITNHKSKKITQYLSIKSHVCFYFFASVESFTFTSNFFFFFFFFTISSFQESIKNFYLILYSQFSTWNL